MPSLTPLSARAVAPAQLPRLDAGLSWRPVAPTDATARHRLINSIEETDDGLYCTSVGEVTDLLAE